MIGSEYEHISRENVMFLNCSNEYHILLLEMKLLYIWVKVCVGCGGYLVCSECKLLRLHDQHVNLIHILLY